MSTPYFAPTYFAPTYFAPGFWGGAGGGAAAPDGSGAYFAPTYFAPAYFAPAYFPGGTPGAAAVAPTFVAAVVARLRSYDGGSLAAALGETTSAKKVWSGQALASPALPWVRVTEHKESLGSETPGDDGVVLYYGHGTLQADVFADSLSSARALRKRVAAALNDAPLTFADGTLLYLRWDDPDMAPVRTPGVGAGAAYGATVMLKYIVERTF